MHEFWREAVTLQFQFCLLWVRIEGLVLLAQQNAMERSRSPGSWDLTPKVHTPSQGLQP